MYTPTDKKGKYRYYLPFYKDESLEEKIKQGGSRYIELDSKLSKKAIVLKEFAEDEQKKLRDSDHQFSMLLDLDVKDVLKTVYSLLAKEIDCKVYSRYIIGSKGKVTSLKLKANLNNYAEIEQLNKPVFESLRMPIAIEFKIDDATINMNTLCELKVTGKLSKKAKSILADIISGLDVEG